MPGATDPFPPYHLDLAAGQLRRGTETVHLRPRTWEVLRHLASRPGQLVTKDDLLDAVWKDAVVSEGTLTNSIRELRAALDDDARSPRYIETVHRRGFRFLVRLGGVEADEEAGAKVEPRPRPAAAPAGASRSSLVGRDREIGALVRLALEASSGTSRVALLGGEAGIGKTSVVTGFLAALRESPASSGIRVATGRAVGYLQGAPPYQSLLSAIESLATGDDSVVVLAALRRHAADLLAQMPWLSDAADSGADLADLARLELATRLVDFFEEVTGRFPVVLVLEDLHDADAPTVDFLATILEHASRLRLFVVATCRPGEAVLAGDGLAQTLAAIAAHERGCAIDLELLDAAEVAAYLRGRRPSLWSDAMTEAVHRRSGGNPLFMVTLADTVELSGTTDPAIADVPDSLRGLLASQLRTLEFRQREVLVAAAVVGVEFSSLAVAAAAGASVESVEETCDALVRHDRFLRLAGVADWPAGGVGQSYAFRHELYRSALYESLPQPRRQALHQRIGEALEAGYAGATKEIAAELADHFGHSGDCTREVRYLREAALTARGRFAHREALDLLDRAVALVGRERDEAVRDPLEFGLQVDRAAAASSLYGFGSALARETTERVEFLGQRLPPSTERFFSLLVVFGFQIIRSDIRAATRLSAQMSRMADSLDTPIERLGATSAAAMAASARGDLEVADRGFRAVLAAVPREFRLPNFRDVLVPTMAAMAQNLCYLDRGEEAGQVNLEAIARADWLGDHFERASARISAASCAAIFGDRGVALRWAVDAAAISKARSIDETDSIAEILAAWADVDSPVAQRRRRALLGLRGLEKTGHLLRKGFHLDLLAQIEIDAGDLDAASAWLSEAREFCDSTGSHRHSAELCLRMSQVESRRDRRRGPAGASARNWIAEAGRIARAQGCGLVLRRLAILSDARSAPSYIPDAT